MMADYVSPMSKDERAQQIILIKSALKGALKGLGDIYHVVTNPMPVIKPTMRLLYDASNISSEQPMYLSPGLFNESAQNMTKRARSIQAELQSFRNAQLPDQIETISRGLTSLFVPGGVLKGARMLNNYRRYGEFIELPLYHNTSMVDVRTPLPDIKYFSLEGVRGIKAEQLLYVYTDQKKLLIADQYPIFSDFGPVGESVFNPLVIHPEVAGLRPVHAAGEIIVYNGQIHSITNRTGHYLAGKNPEKIFIRNGYKEALGKFEPIDYVMEDGSGPIVTLNKIPHYVTPIPQNAQNAQNTQTSQNLDFEEYDDFVELEEIDWDLDRMDKFNIHPLASKYILPSSTFLDSVATKDTERISREDVLEWSSNMGEIGYMTQDIAQIALLAGGHKRTWTNISNACSSLVTMSSSIASILSISATNGVSFLSLTSGWIGVGLCAVSILSSVFGSNDDDNGLQEAFQGIHDKLDHMMNTFIDMFQQLHRTLLEGFQRVENLILNSVVTRLVEALSKLDHLESSTSLSFKELHTDKLNGVIDAIKKDIGGEHVLSSNEKRKYTRKLSTWIDINSKSPLQTSMLLSGSNNLELYKADVLNILPFLICKISELTHLFRNDIAEGITRENINNLPNIPTFILAVDTYISCVMNYQANTEVLIRAKSAFILIHDLINKLVKYECRDVLMRQYEYIRLLIGNQIAKTKTDDPAVTNLMNELKLRILLINSIEILCNMPITHFKEHKFEPGNTLNSLSISERSKNGLVDLETLKTAIYNGLDINAYDSWGQPIHHAIHNHSSNPTLLHLLLKCPNLESINNPTISASGPKFHGFGAIRPILGAMQIGSFYFGILLCAQGHDISEHDGYANFLVAYNRRQAERAYYMPQSVDLVRNSFPVISYHPYFTGSDLGDSYESDCYKNKLCISLTKEMNKVGSNLYRDNLRKAYQYFKDVENGFFGTSPMESCKEVSAECLLLLSCIVGNLYPFICYNLQFSFHKVDLNQKLEEYGFTYLMMACHCGAGDVVKYLLENGARPDIEISILSVKYSARDFANDAIKKTLDASSSSTTGDNDIMKDTEPPLLQPFQYMINRIDAVLSSHLHNKIAKNREDAKNCEDNHSSMIELLSLYIDELSEKDKKRVLAHIQNIKIANNIEENLDAIDSIYLIANKKQNFGYNLSHKIERLIKNL